jgi:cystathionine gamma-synthase
MSLAVKVISQQPPGGRCNLYAGYAEVLARHLGLTTQVQFSDLRDAHAEGYPSLLLAGQPLAPADGVILMPADLLAGLQAAGIAEQDLQGLAEGLEEPLERMMEQAG